MPPKSNSSGRSKSRSFGISPGLGAAVKAAASLLKSSFQKSTSSKQASKLKLRIRPKTESKSDYTTDKAGPHTLQMVKLGKKAKKPSKKFADALFKAMNPPMYYEVQNVTQLATTSGASSFQASSPFPSETDINNMAGYIPSQTVASKFIIESSLCKIDLVSAELANIFVQAFLVKARIDLPLSIVPSALALLRQGYIDNGSTFTLNSYGTAPVGLQVNTSTTIWSSRKFLSYFKVVKSEKYMLEPGESKQYIIKDNRPKTINMEILDNTDNLMSKGGLIYIFQVTGSSADDNATKLVVGTTAAKINITQQESYIFRPASITPSLSRYVGTTNQIITAPVIVNPLIDNAQVDGSV